MKSPITKTALAKNGLALFAAYRLYRRLFPEKKYSVNGKLALITGAASGVGRELALEMAKQGSSLILWDVQAGKLEETKRIILKAYPSTSVEVMVCNLADREEIIEKANQIIESGAKVDIIVNNAGIVSGKYFTETDHEKIDLVMRVNALAHMHIVKRFLPQMIERKSGHIVAVASVAGLIGASGMTEYSASKFAARGFMESLALELYERNITGITVSCVCPTLIDTGLFKGFHVLGNPTLKTSQVVQAVIDAIEYDRELVVVPGYLQFTTTLIKSFFELDGQLGIRTPLPSPMKNFDDSQVQQAFSAMRQHETARL